MLKAEVTKEVTKINAMGNMSELCADICNIMRALNERFSETNPEMAHEFRVVFTTGFMEGFCFDDDREHMEHYLAEGRKVTDKKGTAREVLFNELKDILKSMEDDSK